MLFIKNIYREYFINSEIGIIYNINIYILAYVYIAVIDFPQFLFSGWDPIASPIKRIIFIKSHIPRYLVLKRDWYCANVCGCRETGWRDPTGFLNIYNNVLFIYCDMMWYIICCWLCVFGWYWSFLFDILNIIKDPGM